MTTVEILPSEILKCLHDTYLKKSEYPDEAIILFGSRVREDFKEGSKTTSR